MRGLIVILIFACLIQSTFLPINLVLMILIIRSFIVDSKSNFYLAFIFGLVVSLLQGQIIGPISLINLFSIALVSVLKKSQIAQNLITLMLVGVTLLTVDHIIESVIIQTSIDFKLVIYHIVIFIPVYLLVRFLEERFVVQKEIKLKIKS